MNSCPLLAKGRRYEGPRFNLFARGREPSSPRADNTSAALARIEIRRDFPPSSEAVALVREVLDGWLSDLVGEEVAVAARLAASELVANAVKYGGLGEQDTIVLSGLATDEIVRIEVEQPSSAADAHVVLPGEREPIDGGFGLRIVDEVSTKWGVRSEVPGAVWFEVDR